MERRLGLRLLATGVWLHQGTWNKLLSPDRRHRRIVGDVPGLPPGAAGLVTAGLGIGETALALWVLSGRRPRLAASVQTVAVTAMTAGGLAFGRDAIPHPGRLVARNAAFLACVWSGR